MWCSTCQRDVPALGSPSGGCLRCTKCGRDLIAAQPDSQPGDPAPAVNQLKTAPSLATALRHSPLADADWQLEADLRGVHRLVTSLKSRVPNTHKSEAPARHLRIAHHPEAQARDNVRPPRNNPEAKAPVSATHTAGWLILSLGLATFACGAFLLAWSVVAKRQDLWPIGMPLTLLGQSGLILGLVLQLDGLWTASRNTAAVLSELDGELKNVRQATTLLSSTHSTSGQSFYLHLAEGASPHLLLTDLKGQLDLLAQQMARHGH